MLRFTPVGLLIFSGMLGCKTVQSSDMTGTWALKDASRKSLLAELQNASAKLVLEANGMFIVSDILGLFYFHGRHPAQLESGTGIWKLVSHDGKQQVQLDFKTISNCKDVLPYGTQLDVSKGSLFYFLGDPDEGRRIAFEKK